MRGGGGGGKAGKETWGRSPCTHSLRIAHVCRGDPKEKPPMLLTAAHLLPFIAAAAVSLD